MTAVPTIRVATCADRPELERLLERPLRSEHDAAKSATASARRYQLVVDAPSGGLCAAAIVALAPPHAHLEALAIDERYACHELEARLIGVAGALAEAFGCASLDVPGRMAA
jgi:hypothetical protein